MKAVDTNILARFMLGDDPLQSPIARDLVKAGVFVPLTVLLELGWLLQSRYGFERTHLAASLLDLFDVPGIVLDDDGAVRNAVAAYAKGGDFADHIHLVAAKGVEAFLTFDRRVAANDAAGIGVEVVGW
ncbi:putative nucleic-acid-binding protein [Sphingopyxis panaciterrae]|uniref:type II toxin-antitoxin system VapC family toxin n=1 Tax=Sphingopyxis panaciterrae TaxID=363841 RepID=UPI00141E3648|nr:type II toxin-antitoxin system VapC family toxin [Sphingopyxis panaciterrae]NIJ39365.1 putative nucleic-acid-binding protein [Sphingopyxis panaciterrae]